MRDHVAAQEECIERYVGARIPLDGFRADYLKTTLQIESYYFLGLYFLWKLYGQCRAQVFAIFTAASEFSGVQDVDVDEVAFRDISGNPEQDCSSVRRSLPKKPSQIVGEWNNLSRRQVC
jgi:hypothetical protein